MEFRDAAREVRDACFYSARRVIKSCNRQKFYYFILEIKHENVPVDKLRVTQSFCCSDCGADNETYGLYSLRKP